MAEIYRIFSNDWSHLLDYSDNAIIEMYNSESYGTPVNPNNGYKVGKTYLNLHVNMWKKDIKLGLLREKELYDDGNFPHWWLDSIFKN